MVPTPHPDTQNKTNTNNQTPPIFSPARSVASMSGLSPASMRSGRIASVDSTPVAMRTQSCAVSNDPNISGHASWKSLLYVVGVPLMTDMTPAKLPAKTPAFPRISSRASGFFF